MNKQTKMGRPTNNPKNYRLAVRVNETTYNKLNELSKKLNQSKTHIITRGICLVFQENNL